MAAIRVFACDSQPIVLEGLRTLLADCSDFQFTAATFTLDEALAEIESWNPDLTVIDHGFGLGANMRFLAHVSRLAPSSRPVIWGLEVDYTDRRAYREAGVLAVAEKTWSLEAIRDCLRTVGTGKTFDEGLQGTATGLPRRRLTPRELDVARLVCNGLNNRQVAEKLSITSGTVKVHLMHVFEKTGTRDRYELALHHWRFLSEEAPVVGKEAE